ncbi:hypothetical protein PTTG_00100 [Puccinia triticina 1-1 BBBD Race 1]|uniref:Uncharacterized protein n=1 Tax=Puccinia triticina (isolate 1-1 / race 1 (BBBD)) TaxID=630390 RepID=A0A180GWW4_PUCT1|nr:hypothetical protein PTTG_00100 [Puccinia triticina 1-1 BBBD Race 1]WAR55508.1 hypothetical protein PtB15_6B249 [Puccinia triticina]
MDDSLHQRANFPPNLAIACAHQTRFGDDLAAFGIAAKTWDASFALLDYLLPPAQASPRKRGPAAETDPPSPLLSSAGSLHIIDLGSGTCYLPIGLARRVEPTARQSIKITATDLPAVLPLLERNIAQERTRGNPAISARALAWGDTQQTIDLLKTLELAHQPATELLVTCSDLVFFPFLFAPLLRTLLILTSPQYLPSTITSTPVVLFGYKERSAVKEFPFFSLLGRYFKLEPILSRSDPAGPWELFRRQHQSSDGRDGDDRSKIYLLRATRHPSTIHLDLQSTILKNHTDNADPDRQDPLLTHGDGSASDQWEWILLSNLSDHSIF